MKNARRWLALLRPLAMKDASLIPLIQADDAVGIVGYLERHLQEAESDLHSFIEAHPREKRLQQRFARDDWSRSESDLSDAERAEAEWFASNLELLQEAVGRHRGLIRDARLIAGMDRPIAEAEAKFDAFG